MVRTQIWQLYFGNILKYASKAKKEFELSLVGVR